MQEETHDTNRLELQVGLTASPVLHVEKKDVVSFELPATGSVATGGFSLSFTTTVPYTLLSKVIDGVMAGKRIVISEGFFANHIVVKNISLKSFNEDGVLITCQFTGSFTGTVLFRGKPVYNASLKTVDVGALTYELQTKNLLLKGARWLLAGRIEKELKKATSISLAGYFAKLQLAMENYLNREWTKGITGAGNITELTLMGISALPDYLSLQATCSGNLRINISANELGFLG